MESQSLNLNFQLLDISNIKDNLIANYTSEFCGQVFEFIDKCDKGGQEKCLGIINCLLQFSPSQSAIIAVPLYVYVLAIDVKHAEHHGYIQSGEKLAHKLRNFTNLTAKLSSSTVSEDLMRQFFLAALDDIFMILIRLLEVIYDLHNTPQLAESQSFMAEVTQLYAPLAGRLGYLELKWQLEDFCFKYTQPEDYRFITKELGCKRRIRENNIENIVGDIKLLLNKSGVKFAIKARVKHLYSIYNKVKHAGLKVQELADLYATRIIVATIDECYEIYACLKERFPCINDEFDDYIQSPKPSGYQSLHMVIIFDSGLQAEVQIRTQAMDQAAEHGVASHWLYKTNLADPRAKRAWLNELLSWQAEVSVGHKFKWFSEQVYAISPRGDIICLRKGATVLDFAYSVHTDIGHACIGGKINGRIVPLTTKLTNGDQVDIMTKRGSRPSRDWLRSEYGYVVTKRAINKIMTWFKKVDMQAAQREGQRIFDNQVMKNANLRDLGAAKLLDLLGYKSLSDLHMALGFGKLTYNGIMGHFARTLTNGNSDIADSQVRVEAKIRSKAQRKPGKDIRIVGHNDLSYRLARCCRPVPGDNIIGYITRGQGVTIHRQGCSILSNMQSVATCDARWETESLSGDRSIVGKISLQLKDSSHGVEDDIVKFLQGLNIKLTGYYRESLDRLIVSLDVAGLAELESIMVKLKSNNNVAAVERM